MEKKYKVAEKRNTQVKYKYQKIVLKNNTWVNVLSFHPWLYDILDLL